MLARSRVVCIVLPSIAVVTRPILKLKRCGRSNCLTSPMKFSLVKNCIGSPLDRSGNFAEVNLNINFQIMNLKKHILELTTIELIAID